MQELKWKGELGSGISSVSFFMALSTSAMYALRRLCRSAKMPGSLDSSQGSFWLTARNSWGTGVDVCDFGQRSEQVSLAEEWKGILLAMIIVSVSC